MTAATQAGALSRESALLQISIVETMFCEVEHCRVPRGAL